MAPHTIGLEPAGPSATTSSCSPPHRVRPYVTGNKTDREDAKAILEAARNHDIRHVPVKTIEQQFLAELLEDPDSPLPNALRPVLAQSSQEIAELERRLATLQTQLNALARSVHAVQLLRSTPGIGPITATALIAFVGGPNRFPSGRYSASYLGLTPKEHSSGLSRRLGGISKRGNTYLRMLLIHGARSVLASAKRTKDPDPIRIWDSKSNGKGDTTRPLSRSPTSSLASLGPSGRTTDHMEGGTPHR